MIQITGCFGRMPSTVERITGVQALAISQRLRAGQKSESRQEGGTRAKPDEAG